MLVLSPLLTLPFLPPKACHSCQLWGHLPHIPLRKKFKIAGSKTAIPRCYHSPSFPQRSLLFWAIRKGGKVPELPVRLLSPPSHPTWVAENYLQLSKQLCCSEKGGFFGVFPVLANLIQEEKPHLRSVIPQEDGVSVPCTLLSLTGFRPIQHPAPSSLLQMPSIPWRGQPCTHCHGTGCQGSWKKIEGRRKETGEK